MLLPWLMIIGPVLFLSDTKNIPYETIIIVLPLAFWFGFWLQAYTQHFHEAAHYNLHKNKQLNDRVSNILLTPFTGMWVKNYRILHWRHHRFLGGKRDTEVSYQKPIGLLEITKSLTGIYLAATVMRYMLNFRSIQPEGKSKTRATNSFILSLVVLAVTQIVIALIMFEMVSVYCALAWLINIFIIGPFFTSIRQTAEHRSFNAQRSVDYSEVDHGAVNRTFGTDFFSRYFGAAGFNRHMLHHLDPSVTYTKFDELEEYLVNTYLAEQLQKNKSSYFDALMRLAKQ